jgi:hypothetical protein
MTMKLVTTSGVHRLTQRAGLWSAVLGAAWLAPGPLMSAGVASRSGELRATTPGDGGDSAQWVEMQNVDLHIDAHAVMRLRSLRGEVRRTRTAGIASLDDPTSFRIRATSGVVALDGSAITALLNEIAFNYPKAPIRHLRVRIDNGSVVQKGTLHKGVDIPFEMWAVPVLQPDGRLRLHPDKLRIFSVNGLTLMHALGLHLANMMDLSKARGASVKGDDIYLDPLQIIPPPTVEGRLAAVRVDRDLLVMEFVRTPDDTVFGTVVRPDSGAHNFVYFRGGLLKFGKLTMTDADLLIHDADERDPLDLYFADYNRQLVAGYTKNLPNFGLRTWMIDHDKLGGVGAAVAVEPKAPR